MSRDWEERLAEALRQAQADSYPSSGIINTRWLEREELYGEWLKSREPKKSWRRVFCVLFDHSWTMQGLCMDCGAVRPPEARQ